ncbi:MAG: HDOD domain-containing protein [Desulfuromonadales bacterium]|nr:HDOD domain-containing protein [Desulfuromonadales bacterium]
MAKEGQPDIGSVNQLLAVPQVAAQLLAACQGTLFSPSDLEKIIQQDSALCVRVLHAAARSDSVRIDPGKPLVSALSGLSLAVVKSLALQSAHRFVDHEFSTDQAQLLRQLRFFSQVGATTAFCLAEAVTYPHPAEAYLAGLLVNIGNLALFSASPQHYLQDVAVPLGSRESRGREQLAFGTDHLQFADTLVSDWRIDSFLADAICLQQQPIEDCRDASVLVRIVRLAREFCESPLTLTDGLVAAADTLFGFSRSRCEELFSQASRQYRPLVPVNTDAQATLEEFDRSRRRLTSLAFAVAEQDAVYSQLAAADDPLKLAADIRQIYLQNSPAGEVVLFGYDRSQARFIGIPAPGQSRLIAELNPPVTAAGALGAALRSSKPVQLCAPASPPQTVLDRQLLRLCRGTGVVCLPLQENGQLHGVVALGVADQNDIELFFQPPLQQLTAAVTRALQAVTRRHQANGRQASTATDNPIPRLVHEISTPLTIIGNYMGALGTLSADNEQREMVTAIETELRRVSDLLKFYAERKESAETADAAVDLNRQIQSIVDSLGKRLFRPRQIDVVLDLDPTLVSIRTRPVAIQQALVNLLKNAAEALPSRDGIITLTTRALTGPDGQHSAEIRVQDNGPGIDARIRARLFSPVASTKGGEHAGLGLSIVKEMVDQIGATVSCHSSAEFGTSFSIEIPLPESSAP